MTRTLFNTIEINVINVLGFQATLDAFAVEARLSGLAFAGFRLANGSLGFSKFVLRL